MSGWDIFFIYFIEKKNIRETETKEKYTPQIENFILLKHSRFAEFRFRAPRSLCI